MEPEGAGRRLAAIMFTDLVGSTALTARSEAAGLRAKERHRELVREQVGRYGGELLESPGDETLSLFGSAVHGVNCALALRDATAAEPDVKLHVGIHLGDVLLRGQEIHGDGVNIAARLLPLSEGGGICISDEVQHAVQNQENIETLSLGEHEFKNVGRPIMVFRVQGTAAAPSAPSVRSRAPSFGGRPAIAVLPFDNLSGDPDQEYLADGITEDLIRRLSSKRWFPVVARNSTFVYKAKPVDVRQIARELDVGYIVQGSVRKAGKQIRISAQLIDASTGHWS